jgi:putative exosortase-associated protein (TIGR04073 family)
MRPIIAMIPFLLILIAAVPSFGQEQEKPEWVVGKMSGKLVRGVTNIATSPAELPKQTYLTVCNEGAVGYVIGPLKGIGMTVYRAFIGVVETVFFLVPQPGYYDPTINPAYVWQGWEPRAKQPMVVGDSRQEIPAQEKGMVQ